MLLQLLPLLLLLNTAAGFGKRTTFAQNRPRIGACCRLWTLPHIRGGDAFPPDSSQQPRGVKPQHHILQEEVLHNHWRKLINRRVQLPSMATADFEIVSQGDRGGTVSDQAVLVFVWNSQTKTAVLVREYMPSIHQFLNGLAAGMVEQKHNVDNKDGAEEVTGTPVETAARHELEEECRLAGGKWYCLCQPTVMDKYTTTRLSVYLVIDPDPIHEDDAKPRDDTEEGMETVEGISVSDLRRQMERGEMTVVGGWATQLALHKLAQLGEIQQG